MSNTATEVQVSLCNFCENKPVMDGSNSAQEFLEAEIELAVGLISNSATYYNWDQKWEHVRNAPSEECSYSPFYQPLAEHVFITKTNLLK